MNRLTASQKLESAWTSMIAAQASQKDMKRWMKRWERDAKGPGGAKSNDLEAFLNKVGGGF